MEREKNLKKMLSKCDIYYEDMLISSEEIIKSYLNFFSSQLSSEGKVTNFSFHTGSICFDLASIVALCFSCFLYNLNSNDEILRSLQIGDMVLYRGERYYWEGIKKNIDRDSLETEYVVLKQDPKGKNGSLVSNIPYERNKQKIRPYFGEASATDGRGIRKNKSNRNEFLSYILNIPENEVPSSLDISVVVLAEKGLFIDICQHLRIIYGKQKTIKLTDIVPVSYFTGSGEESQIGKNPTKEEAVIKAVSKTSAARDLILSKQGNKVIGLLATNIDSLSSNASDFKDLIRRKALRFSMISTRYNTEFSDFVLDQYEDASIFACTKDYLSSIPANINSDNKLTRELSRQILNVQEGKLEILLVEGGQTWDDYKKIKNEILSIRNSAWNDSEKEKFMISSFALLNLFTSAFFSIDKMESAIEKGQINPFITSPKARINELYELSKKAPFMKETCKAVADSLLKLYTSLETTSPKEDLFRTILLRNKGKKIAIIVPKAYYSDLFDLYFQESSNKSYIFCTTVNGFNHHDNYDLILVIGDVFGKKFDALQGFASQNIQLLLYDSESILFNYRKHKFEKSENKLNARIKGEKVIEYNESIQIWDNDRVNVDDETIKDFTEIDEYIKKIGMFDITKLISIEETTGEHNGTAEVNFVGSFYSGEQILFSKYYSAVVYDRMAQKVAEASPEKLSPGDVLVFTKKTEFTRNIVDTIFDQLLERDRLPEEVHLAVEKSVYWKEVLRNFKEENNLSFRELSKKLKKYGSTLHETTIRQWLHIESHIVGPRNENTIAIIAQMTNDHNLKTKTADYFEACRIVRYYRREILSLIAQAINDKLSNKVPSPGSVFEVVYGYVDVLSETKELEYVYELEQTAVINNNLVNRPIAENEVVL